MRVKHNHWKCVKPSQHAILAKKFVEVMTKYNEAQVDFRDKSKGRIARQLEISECQLTGYSYTDSLTAVKLLYFFPSTAVCCYWFWDYKSKLCSLHSFIQLSCKNSNNEVLFKFLSIKPIYLLWEFGGDCWSSTTKIQLFVYEPLSTAISRYTIFIFAISQVKPEPDTKHNLIDVTFP